MHPGVIYCLLACVHIKSQKLDQDLFNVYARYSTHFCAPPWSRLARVEPFSRDPCAYRQSSLCKTSSTFGFRIHVKNPLFAEAQKPIRVEHPKLVVSMNYRLSCTMTERRNGHTRLRVLNGG